MRKLICLSAAVLLLISGCSAANTPAASAGAQASEAAASAGSPSATLAVAKSGGTVKVTIPATLVNGNADDAIASAKAKGVDDVVKNADGSLTYTMSNDAYQTMLGVLKSGIEASIAGMKTQGTYASVKDIAANSNFTEITVTVDQEKFKSSMDMFALLSLYISAAYYEAFSGQASPKVTFHLVDAATKTEFQKLVYPDDMKTGS